MRVFHLADASLVRALLSLRAKAFKTIYVS